MARYHEISADAIESYLVRAGFERTVQHREVVYVKASRRDPNVFIKVYTSIRAGASYVRRKGADAIRVCVIYDDGRRSFGIGKFPKVLRTTSDEAVIERLRARLFQARDRGAEWMDAREREQVCEQPGDEMATEFD